MVKKSRLWLVAGTGVLVAGHAQAQSNVQLYGLIDLSAVSYQTHANAAGDHSVSMGINGEPWFSGSRFGMKGAEDLGGGIKAIFKLEAEYRVSDGAMEDPGQIFDRDAWVGVESAEFGKITAGFQNTVARDAAAIYGDPYTSAALTTEEGGWTNTNNFKQLIFYAGSATGTRYQNSVVWKKLFQNGIFAAAGYAFGNRTSFGNNATYTAALGYNGGPFNLSSYYNHVNNNGFTNKSYSVGGNYTYGIARVNAGYFHYTGEQGALGQRKDNAWTVSFKLAPKGPLDYEIGYQQMHTTNAAFDDTGGIANANLTFDPDTGTGSGYKETLYGSVFYHLSKRTELYVAGDYMRLHKGYVVATTYGAKNQLELTTGIRTRF
ncbi:porin [Paraburkholderia flava]|uniref:porin n=1 Tax=Paraburkholderia flava TaxID=2547393 RepID=UPI001060D472|nr:porin [Paraburkholderia flava]